MDASITPQELQKSLELRLPLLIVDVRRESVFLAATDILTGAVRRDPETVVSWAGELPPAERIVVYCVAGHEVSRDAAQALRDRGVPAQFVEGGLNALRNAGFELLPKPAGASTRWVTRERPKVDRIACPWLIRCFIDRNAEFLYVPAAAVRQEAADKRAIPYDIPDVDFSHYEEKCSFDAFIRLYGLTDPALLCLADIVRGADTTRWDFAPQAAGLAALSMGLSRLIPDDYAMLKEGMVIYDALYLWCREDRRSVQP
jgi:rhodanese-related sulfurtransferase